MSNYVYAGGSQPPLHNAARAAPISKPVFITGGSGKLGRAVVKELNDRGYYTIVLDIAAPPADTPPANRPKSFVKIDLTSMGDVLSALTSVDDRYTLSSPSDVSVVHLGAIPAPGLTPNHVVFQTNVVSTYNVLEACRLRGIRNIVLASSETLIGLPLDPVLPDRLPITESQPPRPESSYSLSKLLGEVTAEQYCRWDPSLKVVSLRFSNVMEVKDYETRFRTKMFQEDEVARRWNAFGYIDARDGAQACRLALEKSYTGHHVYLIANADTVFNAPTWELVERHFNAVEWDPEEMKAPAGNGCEGREGLLSIGKARRELGFEPRYTWRE